jgi:putative transposase
LLHAELASGLTKGTDDETEEVHRRADHRVLREHDAGVEATLYNWQVKYGGMEVSDAKGLRSLEEKNRKLKKLLAESILDQAALKELLTKKW